MLCLQGLRWSHIEGEQRISEKKVHMTMCGIFPSTFQEDHHHTTSNTISHPMEAIFFPAGVPALHGTVKPDMLSIERSMPPLMFLSSCDWE